MTKTESEKGNWDWRRFMKKHWSVVALFVIAAVLAFIGAIVVWLWFAGDAQLTGMVPASLGQWAMSHLVSFMLHLIFWEIIFIVIPVILAAVAGWLWWKRLSDEERTRYHFFGNRSRTTSGGGGMSLLFTIAFCIKVFTDGKWNLAFASWTFDYLVDSMLWTLIWLLIIFGIPIAIGATYWIYHSMKNPPTHPTRKDLAIHATKLMENDDQYKELLEVIQTGNKTKFEEICAKYDITGRAVAELWAAAVGAMSTDAQAAYPGSSGW